MSWTRIDNYGNDRCPYPVVYIESTGDLSQIVMLLMYKIDLNVPGSNLEVEQFPNLEQASGLQRGCSCIYQPSTGKLRWVEKRHTPVGDWEYHEGYGVYQELGDYARRKDILLIQHSEVNRILHAPVA